MATVATVYSDAFGDSAANTSAQVVVVDGPDQGRAARLDAPTLVGGDAACDLVLSDDRVSRQHLRITPVADGFDTQDLDSRNGTLYEGSVLTRARLPLGASLKLGRSTLRIAPVARAMQVEPSRSHRFGALVGRSLVMRELFAVLELASGSDVTVLTIGETGTGKELVARALHDESARRRGPFVAVDCSALPETLIESELFGHVKGAYTGAMGARKGAFARAHGGTLFLDELATMSAAVQARLLRALEERKVRPVGADRETEVDVRVVAGSRDPLDARLADGRFRADLYYRLAVITLRIPALRQRREDVPILVAKMLADRGLDADGDAPAMEALLSHDWPGNVRELRNVVDRAIALTPGARSLSELRFLQPDAGQAAPGDGAVVLSAPWAEAKQHAIDAFERAYLRALLDATDGNVSEASRRCGLDRKQLRALALKHHLLS